MALKVTIRAHCGDRYSATQMETIPRFAFVGALLRGFVPLLLLVRCLAADVQRTPEPLGGRLLFSSMSEFQLGDPRTLYNQLTADYTLGFVRVGVRTEGFRSERAGRDYTVLSQRFVEYRRDRLQATVGHFYAIVGSGLLLHAFELPGVITEGRGMRRRYQIIRDLDGMQLRYRWRRLDLRLLRGTPVDSDLPPGVSGIDRRRGRVQSASLRFSPSRFIELTGSLVEVEENRRSELGASLQSRLRAPPVIDWPVLGPMHAELYGEYAQRDVDTSRLSLERDFPRALYLSGNLTGDSWGASVEYKDYWDFLIQAINNPPTLIREHDAYLLNRQTHDLLADDESGLQVELTRALPGGRGLTANMTRATRRFGPGAGDDRSLREYFLQADSPFSEKLRGQLFLHYARDRLFKNERRWTVGSAGDWSLTDLYAGAFDFQFQRVGRTFGQSSLPFDDILVRTELSRAPNWSWSISLERSTDELQRGVVDGAAYWLAGGLSWRPREGQSVSVFAGKRRSGLACTGGTCYEVLGFEGVEVRLINQIL